MNDLKEVAQVLEQGGIVIFPTETVYGIGCLLNKTEAIKRLYKIKNRSEDQPTLVLVPDLKTAKEYVEFNSLAERLAEKFWPGPLTLVLQPRVKVDSRVLGKGGTLAIRIPDHHWLLSLLNEVSSPLLAPSANFKGEEPPKSFEKIDKSLKELLDYVVAIETGHKKPSTIVSIAGNSYNVIREGEITRDQIESVGNL